MLIKRPFKESSYEDEMYAHIRKFIKTFIKSEEPLKKRWESIMDGDVDRHDDYGDLEMIYRVFRDGYRKNTQKNSDKPGITRRVDTGEWSFIIPICVSKRALGEMGYLGKEKEGSGNWNQSWVGDHYAIRHELEDRLEAAVKKEWPTAKDVEVDSVNYFFNDTPVLRVKLRKHDNSVKGPMASIKKAMAAYEKHFGTKIGEETIPYHIHWRYPINNETGKRGDEQISDDHVMKLGIYKHLAPHKDYHSDGPEFTIQTFGWFLTIDDSDSRNRHYELHILENSIEAEADLSAEKMRTMTSNEINKYIASEINNAFDNAYGIHEKRSDY